MNKRRSIVVLAIAALLAVVLFLVWHLGRQSASRSPCNVLLITLDTTRADHLGCYGYAPALTPALNELAAGGVLFEQAFSNVPMTLPSHATVMTGLLPPEHGVRVNGEQRLDLAAPTLAEIMRRRGYQTGAFIAAVVLDRANGLNRGFDVYRDEVSEAYKKIAVEVSSAYRPGNEVTDDALSWLEKRDPGRPFFCWVHLFDPHTPYFRHKELAGTRYADQATYDGQIAFMDMQIARLTAYLKKAALTETTLVIAFGDHGEGLGEHGEESHGHMLYASTLHVPLVFSQPGRIPRGARVSAMVSLVDLFGTILDWVGAEEVEKRSGRSLAGGLVGHDIASASVYSETQLPFSSFRWSPMWSLTTPLWKYIRSARLHLYDRCADPGEMNNLAAARPPQVQELEKQLRSLEDEMALHSAGQVDMTADAIKRLEALGYIAGGHQNFDTEKMDYASLHDVEDMLLILEEVPRLTTAGRYGQPSEELITELRRIIRITPESPHFRATLVLALIKLNRPQEALPEALEYIKLKPDDHEMCQTIATIYLYFGRPAEAVPYFWKALHLRADFAPAHEGLAHLLRTAGEAEAADRHSRDKLASLGKAAEEYEQGIALAAKQRFGEAVDQFDAAVQISPDDALIRGAFARAMEQRGDFAEAARQAAEALRLDPADPEKLNQLGRILVESGRYAEAAPYLEQYVRLKPREIPARTNLGLVLSKQGKLDEALLHLSEALRLAPGDGQVHITKGGVLEENGLIEEAAAEYREAVRLNPADPDVANHLARVLATNPNAAIRDGVEAVKLAERVCSATGQSDPDFLDTLASAYAEVGRFQDAIIAAKKALAIAMDAQRMDLANQIQQRLDLYDKGLPYHAAP